VTLLHDPDWRIEDVHHSCLRLSSVAGRSLNAVHVELRLYVILPAELVERC